MKQKAFWFLFLIAFGLRSFAQQAPARHEFSIQQCIDYAAKNNVDIKNAMVDVDIQEQQNRSVASAAYPHINGSFTTQYNPNVTVQTFPNFIAAGTYGVLEAEGVKNGNGEPITTPTDFGVIQAPFGTAWSANAGVSLSQILFDGQVFVGLQARKTAIDFRQKNVEVTHEMIKTNISKIYYQLSISNEQIALLDANIGRAQKLLNDSRELYKNGFAEKLDVDRATVQVANLESQKQAAINSISNGYLGLKLLMGMPLNDTVVLTDSVTDESIQQGSLNDTYDYKDRLEFQYLSLSQKLNEFNVRRYKLSKIPTASLNAAYSKLSQGDNFALSGGTLWFPSSYIGLTVNVPIFSGFMKNANIEEAKLELQKTNNTIDNFKLTIDYQVDLARNTFTNAVIVMNSQRKNMELAEEVYNQTKKKYEIGTASTTDITNTQADLITAQRNYLVALYDAALAKVDYLRAIGKL
ncbi:MAG TPA: TolC family protein [Parafilimonas sp.]|nr:TolC family protein [Parafilimonas sp.]